jgi:glucose-6-phosphate 1-dehydrogenase
MSATTRDGDALVVFGITGDLARKMTVRSLYRLAKRGLLSCPVIGVASGDLTDEEFREHAWQFVHATGEPIDDAVWKKFAAQLHYVGGDFADPKTYETVAAALGDASNPVFYLEIPPSLFATVLPPIYISTWTSPSCTGSTTSWGSWAWRRSCTCASPTRCSSRSGTAPTSPACR